VIEEVPQHFEIAVWPLHPFGYEGDVTVRWTHSDLLPVVLGTAQALTRRGLRMKLRRKMNHWLRKQRASAEVEYVGADGQTLPQWDEPLRGLGVKDE
jgi:hypothetical protein